MRKAAVRLHERRCPKAAVVAPLTQCQTMTALRHRHHPCHHRHRAKMVATTTTTGIGWMTARTVMDPTVPSTPSRLEIPIIPKWMRTTRRRSEARGPRILRARTALARSVRSRVSTKIAPRNAGSARMASVRRRPRR